MPGEKSAPAPKPAGAQARRRGLHPVRDPGGIALRFARVKRYRPDKLPVEADTIATARGGLEMQGKGGNDDVDTLKGIT
ncbi:MAG: hypothetical protein A2075_21255 [Geobacteraceae bacterium GWC2_58_44]|nr:MAG: hypothetical protein A2075_21255 [Geobacteraceae bacterium GWC2_58_44]HBG04580.1 hypothetical protein [Geobacter sp.]